MKGGMALNRLGFIVLSILERAGATSKPSAMTVREIVDAEDFGVEGNTVFKKLKDFEGCGYIGRGLKEGRASTFFITPDGSRVLEEERGKA